MIRFAAALLRGVIATFAGLLIAGGTLTLAADRVPVDRPTLVSVPPPADGPATLVVPEVAGQAYVFAKGILQDRGFAWHVTGPVMGYAADTVSLQTPSAGTVVLDTGAPLVTLTLARNVAYAEKGTPDNEAPYRATVVRLPANLPQKPETSAAPKLQPVPVPIPTTPPAPPAAPAAPIAPVESTTTPVPAAPSPAPSPANAAPKTRTAAVAAPAPKTSAPVSTPKSVPTPAPAPASGPRRPDFKVSGSPKEPADSVSLPYRATALATFVDTHQSASAANLNHWLYEHAYIVAGARFGWWHGAQALETLIALDRKAEHLWGVGSQSRTAAEKALAEVRARGT